MNDRLEKLRGGVDVQLADIVGGFALLTRLPVPVDHEQAGERAAKAAWTFPLVGAVLGLIAGLIGLGLVVLGTPASIASVASLAILIMMTGGLHEDGLADCADGFGAPVEQSRRFEIMKDSRIGAFGAVALILALIARWSGTEVLMSVHSLLTFVAIGAASRLPMVAMMFAMPLARRSGMAATVGHTSIAALVLAAVLTLLICLLCVGWSGVLMVVLTCLAAIPVCVIAWQKIQGYTGDVLGASQQVAEIAAIAVAIAFLG